MSANRPPDDQTRNTVLAERGKADGEEARRSQERLYRRCEPVLLRYFRGLGHPAFRADELTQNALSNAFLGLHTFDRAKNKFEGWMFTIAGNAAHDDWKSRSAKRRAGGVQLGDAAGAVPAPPDDPADGDHPAADADRFNRLWSARVLAEGLGAVADAHDGRKNGTRGPIARAFADDLDRFLDHVPTDAENPGRGRRAYLYLRRNRGRLAVAALASAFGLGAGAVGVVEHRRAGEVAARQRAEDTAALVRLADAAFGRGRWAEAAAGYDAALGREPVDRPRLAVARRRCDFRLNRVAGLTDKLAADLADPTLGTVRGPLLLLQAEVTLTDQAGWEAGKDLARQAVAAGLSGAERAVALGLTADAPADALAQFRTALGSDPASHPAHAGLVSLLAVTGRRPDARSAAEVMRRTFPDDPLPDLADALCLLADNDEPAARRAWQALAAKTGGAGGTFDRIAALVATVRAVNLAPGRLSAGEFAKLAAAANAARRDRTTVAGAVLPLGVPMPAVAWWYEAADVFRDGGLAAVAAQAQMGRGRWAEVLAEVAAAGKPVEAAAGRFDAAELCYLAANLRFLAGTALFFLKREAEGYAAIADAERWALRGAGRPTLFPGNTLDVECRAAAALCAAVLARPEVNRPDAPARRDAAVAALAAAGPTYRRNRAAALAILSQTDPDPASRRRLAAAVAVTDPTDPLAWLAVATVEWAADSPATAVSALDRAAGLPLDATQRAGLAALREQIARTCTVRGYPTAAALAGPMGPLALPGVRFELPTKKSPMP
jgi:DNA-directed RNA polymerase specialized sigma24 family protein